MTTDRENAGCSPPGTGGTSALPADFGPGPEAEIVQTAERDFVVVTCKFVAGPVPGVGSLQLLIKRNLAASTKVVAFWAQHVTRSAEGPPGYYGGDVLKGGNEIIVAQPEFQMTVRAVPIHSMDYPRTPSGGLGGPTGPTPRWPAWVQLSWKGEDNRTRTLDVSEVRLTQ